MKPSTEHWLLSTISKRLERIAEGKETMAEDRALTLLSILKDVAGDIPSLTSLPQHVKEWLEAAINARLDAIADKREIAAEDRIATLTEALAALRPPAAPGGSVERVDTGAGLSGGPITTTGTISLSTSSQQAIARANTAVQPEDLADVATSGNYADLTNTPTIPEQFNPIQGANMLITGTYPNITFSAVAGEEFTPVWGEIQGTLSDQTDLQNALDGKAPAVHQHNASDINAGTLANARISQGSVTQHQAALSIGWSQLSGLPAFATRWPTWNEVTGKPSIPQGTVTSVSAGNGMNFTTITGTGAVTMGTPGTLSGSTTNATTATSHTHALSANLKAWDGHHPDNAYVDKGTIPGSVDLNTYRTTGIYHQNANADATSGTNYPANVAGMLTVFESGAMTYQSYQIYNTGDVWTRSRYNTTWSAWKLSVDGTTTISAGNGLSGGGALSSNRTITLGTPSQITATSTNSVTSTSHTHALNTTGNFTWTGTNSFTGTVNVSGHSTSWGVGPTSGVQVGMGTASGATWMIAGFSGSSRQFGIQALDNGSGARFYVGGGFAQLNSSGTWDASAIPSTLNATHFTGGITTSGNITSENNRYYGGSSGDLWIVGNGSNGVGFRPRGWSTTNQTYINNNGDMSVGGTVTASNVTATSDPRLKKNSKKVKARRELIEKLEYWSFEWKKDGTKGRSVMADKVLEIAPEHVHIGDDEDKTLAVDKGALALEMVFALIDMLKETDEETVHDVD